MVKRTLLIVATTIVWLAPSAASADCPAQSRICGAYEGVELVFLGDVVSMEPAAGPRRSGVRTEVGFKVLERFKGEAGDELRLSLQPSSEEFDYALGQRVLVYASRDGNVWRTACTRTRLMSLTSPELVAVRALRDKGPGGMIEGFVGTPSVSVTFARDGVVVAELKADREGRFETGWMEPGSYEVTASGVTPAVPPQRVTVSRDARCLSLGLLFRAR